MTILVFLMLMTLTGLMTASQLQSNDLIVNVEVHQLAENLIDTVNSHIDKELETLKIASDAWKESMHYGWTKVKALMDKHKTEEEKEEPYNYSWFSYDKDAVREIQKLIRNGLDNGNRVSNAVDRLVANGASNFTGKCEAVENVRQCLQNAMMLASKTIDDAVTSLQRESLNQAHAIAEAAQNARKLLTIDTVPESVNMVLLI